MRIQNLFLIILVFLLPEFKSKKKGRKFSKFRLEWRTRQKTKRTLLIL